LDTLLQTSFSARILYLYYFIYAARPLPLLSFFLGLTLDYWDLIPGKDTDYSLLQHCVQTNAAIHLVGTNALSPDVKRPKNQIDHYPPSRAKDNSVIPLLFSQVFVIWCLINHRGNFAVTLAQCYIAEVPVVG
jgi:hypothetical protein